MACTQRWVNFFIALNKKNYEPSDFQHMRRDDEQKNVHIIEWSIFWGPAAIRKGLATFAVHLQIDRYQRYPEGPHQTSDGDTVDDRVGGFRQHIDSRQHQEDDQKRIWNVQRIR